MKNAIGSKGLRLNGMLSGKETLNFTIELLMIKDPLIKLKAFPLMVHLL